MSIFQYLIPIVSAAEPGIITKSMEEKILKGDLTFNDIPLAALNYIENTLAFIGTAAVVMVMVGGVQYIYGGLTENKDQGKKTITYALWGVVVVLLSWFMVDLLLSFLTDENYFSSLPKAFNQATNVSRIVELDVLV